MALIRILVVASSVIAIAAPSFAATKCFSEKEIQRLVKSHGLKEKGSMAVGEVDGNGDAEAWDIAYTNNKTHKFLSVRKNGSCFSDPTFLSQDSYDARYQFEGDSEEAE
ncbi:hypothetical protein OIU34_00075 [Pararhizobium sp. BT-229]|uniref:hypothetical protein n=1 Tax=Pararhizobium sp. BT-229 TaxID=2986923 RepID=UPI0021F6EDE4|nr:hypothetical protein [Pararhizobium sp. BT-229]MCV9960284.1 hypothetical protein [Pararhizobium sp. BT-229]